MTNTNDQKTILVIANNDVGLYNFRFELLEKLILDGNRVVISLPNGNRIKDLENLGCEYIETDISRRGTNPVTDMKLFLSYISILKKIKPDIVLTYTVKPNIYGGLACRIKKTPYVANITGLGTAIENGGVMQKFILQLYKMALKKAQKVFFQNEANMNFFTNKKLLKSLYDLLPGSGVNLTKFEPLEYPEDSNIRFVFIGRLMKNKGIDEYLQAANAIKCKYPNTEFHICGDCEDEYKNKMQSFTENESIVYHGVISDIRKVLNDMHCTIVSSYHEGMSNVLLESAASARPCICSDVPGCKEIVEHSKTGFTFEVKNTDALIEVIEQFLNLSYDEKKQMGLNGRQKVEKEFNRNIVIDKYLSEIRKVAE